MATYKENFEKAIAFITREGIQDLVNWLETETDYFTAPASSTFHGNFEGGLMQHCLNVVKFGLHNFNLLVKEKPDLEYLRESVVIVGLFHDLCKVNTYEKAEKWKKDENNKWVSYTGWVVNDKLPIGHGEKSLFLVSKYIKLTDAEAMAIRWHMGSTEFSTAIMGSPQYYAYYDALTRPLVRLMHAADMLSLTIEEHIDYKNA